MTLHKSLTTGLMVAAFHLFFNSIAFADSSVALEKKASKLDTITVNKKEVPNIQVLNGQVEAVNKSTLSAQTSGSIEQLNYDVGDFVEKGKIIARIKSRTQRAGLKQAQASVGEARASVEQARASYKAAQASAEEANSNFKRTESIYKRKLIARAEFDRAKSAMKTANAQVGAAKAALNAAKAGVTAASARKTQAGEQLGYTEVVAPFSGIVTERHVELGELVTAGKPIMTGISLQELRVVTEVPQGLIKGVRQYKQASVYILGDEPPIDVKSLVFFPYADPLTNAFKVRAELESGLNGIYPGAFVKVAFVVGKTTQLVVPETAVAYRGEVTGVYVLNEDGQPLLRQIRLGRKLHDGNIMVLAGLDDGEVIAKDPVHATLFLKRSVQDTEENSHE
ncbi:MAG: efflux RND transporter periplasmic adaptor subunit [Thiotrichaceae bacterium]